MTNTYLISYDLFESEKDYNDLYKYIKSFPHWVHIFESMWIIESNKKYTTIHNEIINTVCSDDKIFISKIDIQGHLLPLAFG